MKHLIFISLIAIFCSCGSAQKLVEKTTADGGRIVVKKDFFSGIDYLYVEKKIKGKVEYKLLYDCECGIANEISLRKEHGLNKPVIFWRAVTDTIGKVSFFNDVLAVDRLTTPIEFMPITHEELSSLEEGLSKVNKQCCKNPSKPVNQIIGYVRIKVD